MMRGFNPSTAAAVRAKSQRSSRGGMVIGPGTGISDDISKIVESGTFIMPSDSVQQIGPDALASMGTSSRGFAPRGLGKKVPVQLSNGEYQMPPEQVHAVGVQALNSMKEQTHVPVSARGFAPGGREPEPPMFFADGGEVRARGFQPARKNPIVEPAPVRGFQPVPQRLSEGGTVGDEPLRQTRFGDRAASSGASSQVGSIGESAQGLVPHAPNYGAAGYNPRSLQSSPAQASRVDSSAQPTSPSHVGSPALVESSRGFSPGRQSKPVQDNAPMPANDFSARGLGFSETSAPSPATAPVQISRTSSSNVTKTTGPDGGVSYTGAPGISGDITVNGKAPGGTNTVLPSARGFQPGAMAAPVTAPPVVSEGLVPGSGMSVLGSAPGNLMERTDAQQLRDAQVASRSLLNGPRVFNRRGFSGAPPNIAAEEASALMRNQAAAEGGAQASRSNGEIEVLRQKGALNQTMMQQAGENQRSLAKTILQQQTANRTERHLQEQEEIARQRLTLDSVRAANAGLPAGYRRTSDGKSLEAIPGGPADSAVKDGKLNDVQAKALQFGARMRQAGETLDTLASNGISQPSFAKRAADAVGLGVVANWTQSPQQQQVEQSQRDFVNAVLRRESGAAISNAEFDNARQQYFPQMGDSPQVIEQKRRNRDLATRGILAEVPNQEARLQQLQGNEPLQRTLVRSGTFNGRRVTQFSDGSISYAD